MAFFPLVIFDSFLNKHRTAQATEQPQTYQFISGAPTALTPVNPGTAIDSSVNPNVVYYYDPTSGSWKVSGGTPPPAGDTTLGISSLAVAANYPSASDIEVTTPAYVTNAIANQTLVPLPDAFGNIIYHVKP